MMKIKFSQHQIVKLENKQNIIKNALSLFNKRLLRVSAACETQKNLISAAAIIGTNTVIHCSPPLVKHLVLVSKQNFSNA